MQKPVSRACHGQQPTVSEAWFADASETNVVVIVIQIELLLVVCRIAGKELAVPAKIIEISRAIWGKPVIETLGVPLKLRCHNRARR